MPEDGWALGYGEDKRVLRQFGKLNCKTATYGLSFGCEYRMENASEDPQGFWEFDFFHDTENLGHVHMKVPGIFNALSAVAVLSASHIIGSDMAAACRIIGDFTGVRRRFERTGSLNGAEITLVTDIYGQREKDPGDIDSGMLVEGMKKHGINAIWTPSFSAAARVLRKGVQPGDLVIAAEFLSLSSGIFRLDQESALPFYRLLRRQIFCFSASLISSSLNCGCAMEIIISALSHVLRPSRFTFPNSVTI